MKFSELIGQGAVIIMLSTFPAVVHAQTQGCDAIGISNSYLNNQFCSRLKALADNRAVPPTRSPMPLDPETKKLVEDVDIFREAYEVDPAKALELIKRIREAGGLAN